MTVQQTNRVDIEDQPPVTKAKSLRVKVIDNAKDARPAINVNVPIGMVKWGMRMARTFSPQAKDLDLDWDAISAMIDEGARGQIVHVEDEERHKTIEVWVD
jgi:hypothetical protein